MTDIVIAVIAGAALFFITSFVSLAVWAINAKINAVAAATAASHEQARLNEENERLKLEARIAKDLVKPAVDELRDLVRALEEQFELSEAMHRGFAGVHQALADQALSLVRPSKP